MQSNNSVFISKNCFIYALEDLALTLCTWALLGQVVNTKNHILRRNRYRTTIRRLQQVVGRKGLYRQRQMYSHLVTVEVRIERGTYKRMQLDCLTFYQNRFECLNTQSVQSRRTVQHNRMLFNNILQHIPYLCLQALYHLLCALDIVCSSVLNQLLHNEGLPSTNNDS